MYHKVTFFEPLEIDDDDLNKTIFDFETEYNINQINNLKNNHIVNSLFNFDLSKNDSDDDSDHDSDSDYDSDSDDDDYENSINKICDIKSDKKNIKKLLSSNITTTNLGTVSYKTKNGEIIKAKISNLDGKTIIHNEKNNETTMFKTTVSWEDMVRKKYNK